MGYRLMVGMPMGLIGVAFKVHETLFLKGYFFFRLKLSVDDNSCIRFWEDLWVRESSFSILCRCPCLY